MAPKLLISGGGTGGHVSPGLGVANEWLKRHGEGAVAWVGRAGSIEEAMATKAGLPFLAMPSAALRRGFDLRNLSLPFVLLKGFFKGLSLLKAERPAAVLLTGGYVGLPLGLAAAAHGTPLYLLEPNAVPGLANRLLKPLSKALCRSYPPAAPDAKDVVTGTPCRLERLPRPEEAKRVLGLDPGKKTLLVLPGSQAAKAINAALREMLPAVRDRAGAWQILWMTGAAELEACRQATLGSPLAIQTKAFIDDVATAYAASDLVLCRSGASTLAELAVAGKASLQVPYPHATDGHQKANADAFAASGAARVVVEGELKPTVLEGALRELLDQGGALAMAPKALALGKPKAAAAVADLIEVGVQRAPQEV